MTGKDETAERTHRRGRWALAAVAALVCVVAVVFVLRAGCGRSPDDAALTIEREHTWGDDLPLTRVVVLFYPKTYGEILVGEPRRIIAGEGTAGLMKSTLVELGKGPSDEALISPFKKELKIRGVYSSFDGTVFVDLHAGVSEAIGKGMSEEIAAIKAIAGTLFYNFPQVNRIKLLVDGEPARSLSGHVDLSGFLYPEDWMETSGIEL